MSRTTSISSKKTDKGNNTNKGSSSDHVLAEDASSSEESYRQDPSNKKMASKPSKTKITKLKSSPKDSISFDSNQSDNKVQIVPPSFPVKPAKMNKKQYMQYYKNTAHYYKKRHEGAKSNTTIGTCSDISYSSFKGEKGMAYT